MKRNKISLIATFIMTGVLIGIIILAVIFLPGLIKIFQQMRGYTDCRDLMIALYISALPGLACAVSLMLLLLNILKGEIFIKKNVTILRILSYCCLFAGVEYLVFANRYISMILISFAALFFGLILRVIKNVFDRAIELQEENDYTV